MKKSQVSFVCQECGYDTPKFFGKCPECGAWNSMKEVRLAASSQSGRHTASPEVTPKKLGDIQMQTTQRVATSFVELDTVLGGGIVPGAAMLIAGDPGVGKSTLLLQLCMSLAQKHTILYVSGEESLEQIKMRSNRLIAIAGQAKSGQNENLQLLSLTDIDQVVEQIERLHPLLVVVDSIQTMESQSIAGLSGSVAQIRYSALALVRVAKRKNIPVLIVGHVTKDGMVAGPMLLSHMVDTLLFLEGEKFSKTRLIRSFKNRFGPVDEVGVFSMEEFGLKEVRDPSQLFLSDHTNAVPGSVLTVTMEGTRPFLVEIQALTVSSKLPMPRRVVSGIDQRRVELLLAVLQKHCKLPVDTADIFVNVAGGIKIADPGADLSICLAVYASMKGIALNKVVGIGEVGLLGELRKVPSIEKRVKEAKQFGYQKVLTGEKFLTINAVLSSLGK